MITYVIILFYFLGLYFAALALIRSRTPQGAVAWVLSLLILPFFSIPLYVIFGQIRFRGYHRLKKRTHWQVSSGFFLDASFNQITELGKNLFCVLDASKMPGVTSGNQINLLINATTAYPEMLREIEYAKKYIIVQYYIVRHDHFGLQFIELLIKKSLEGLKIYFMHDAIGCKIPQSILLKMKESGIELGVFNEATFKGKFQINFRNHRKLLVIDGKIGFMGGMNIGDEYLGKTTSFGFWRDTNVKIQGPAVLALQWGASEDWYYIHHRKLDVNWQKPVPSGQGDVVILHSGPADDKNFILLTYLSLITKAKSKIWVASPYFVPPESLMDALLLACLRGVDVRILLPGFSDARLVNLASKVYQKKLISYGGKIFSYQNGFLHQKVMVIDDDLALIGSMNFDFRSMYINFENAVVSSSKSFVFECTQMLLDDFNHSSKLNEKDLPQSGQWDQIICKTANLMAPLL